MNRKLLSIILIVTVAIMTGCSTKQTNSQLNASANTQSQQSNESNVIKDKSNTESDSSTINDTKASTNKVNLYNVIENTYKIANITIKYPQISNLGDADRQSQINKLIKNSVIEGYDLTETIKTGVIPDYNEPIENLTMDVTYSIELQDENILSIKYLCEANMKNSAHPNNYLYTTNIDISDAKILKLSDMFVIDKTLVNAFKNGTYIPWSKDFDTSDNKTLEENLKREISNYYNDNDQVMITSLKQSDNPEGPTNSYLNFSYLTKDGLVISTGVSHAEGDHAEFKIPYNALKHNIKTDNKALHNLLESS
ncbi:PdaC/SigV domain-containing protein [Clostridium sp.]|uniref:PdaC/SigV domain-containing protein n=1 Tax=Clostridium sp. TaxID=1506 RepID=UPI00284ACDAB|nr:DUF4163 domain-containing protein [Clostridium sp.]MDR3598343.1 hypothetical protein [Clostridium sp.]